ncbi:MAG: hypothetical protein J6Q55_01865, partial [Clostridia bacterium]|nr:hypothetical protein [Clostridia bacterium]
CMCEDSFNQVLGLRFSSIDFKVEKITGHYQADIETARQQAKTLEAERKFARDCYQYPLCDDCQPTDNQAEPSEQTTSTQQAEPATENVTDATATEPTDGQDDSDTQQ